MKEEDFEVHQACIPFVGIRYFVRRHPRILGIRMPWTVGVKNKFFGGVPMFFSEKQVNRQIESMCGKDNP